MPIAIATFHSLRGAKKTSVLLLIKRNPLQFSSDPVYVPLAGAIHFAGKSLTDEDKGFTFEIPDGYTLEDIVDSVTGEVRTTADGSANLKQLVY
jgi:hypothetical protein